jgi:hypothetical protein
MELSSALQFSNAGFVANGEPDRKKIRRNIESREAKPRREHRRRTEVENSKSVPPMRSDDETLRWMEEHLSSISSSCSASWSVSPRTSVDTRSSRRHRAGGSDERTL